MKPSELLSSEYELFTIKEVAMALRVSVATVRRLIQKGDLSSLQFGGTVRVTRNSLERLLSGESHERNQVL